MAVRQCSDLGCMGDAQDLVALCALAQYLTNTPGGFARNTAVDLIIDHGRHGILIGHCIFDGQRDAAQLAAGSNFCKGFGRLTGVCGNVELDAVLPMACQRAAGMAQCHAHARHVQKIQRAGNTLVQLFKSAQARLGQCFCLFTGQRIEAELFCLQVVMPLL